MAGEVQLVYTISKKAYKLVKAGKLVLDSGGVRDSAGKLYELAKPALSAATSSGGNPVIAGATLASSVINNGQTAFLQHSVNITNKRLAQTLKKLDLLQGSLGSIAGLSWVNCALGMVNCGISIAGFKMTLDRLKDATEQIQGIATKIDKEVSKRLKREFNEFRMNIKADMDALERFELTDSEKSTIDQHFAAIIAYLEEVIERFENREIDGQLGCSIIFNLTIGFCQEVKEYSAQYYYENGKLPPNYEEWIAVLDKINSEAFREYVKRYFIFDTDFTMEEKYMAFDGAMYAIESKKGEIDFNLELIHRLSLDQYRNQEALLLERIDKDDIYEVDDVICIPVA